MGLESRKLWKDEGGVSEVVGNILILMITVILFSSIIAFVGSMPVPEQATKADFSASISFWENGAKANLTVTKAGGAIMDAEDTMIIVDVDDVNEGYDLGTDEGLGGADQWKTGMSWTKTLTGTTYTSTVVVTVIDLVKHASVWTSQVTGGTGGNPPSILQRYADSDRNTSTADPVREWDDFSLFVTIVDPDNDLNTTDGIWIDSSQVEGASYTHRLPAADSPGGGVYRWDFNDIQTRDLSAEDLDGGVIMIHAWDSAGHKAISSFVLTITQLPVQEIPVSEEDEIVYTGDSNLPSYIRWFFANQGFGVFPERYINGSETGRPETSTISTHFDKDHLVFVRFASKVMDNVAVQNDLTLTDIRTGVERLPAFNESAGSTAANPFYSIPSGGGIYLFEAQFNTSTLPPGAYGMEITLKNNPTPPNTQAVYTGSITLFVSAVGSPITDEFFPEIELYKDQALTTVWGERTTPFEISSSDSFRAWVAIRVLDTETASPPPVSVAEIRISDGSGAAELYGVPPAGSMMSRIWRYDPEYYNFSIDLRLNNGVQWRAGTNSYTIEISKFNDTNEGIYSLSHQIFVKGAGARADFLVGTTGMAGGQSNFNSREYLYHIQNNLLFSTRIMWLYEATPSANNDYTVTALGVGDLDGDGDRDVLMGQGSSNYLYYFENTLNTFGIWQSGSQVSRPEGYASRVSWITFGDVNGDGDQDFAWSSSAGQVVIYNTTYGSTGWIYTPPATKGWSTPVAKIALEDMTGDGRADLVVLGGGDISVYDLKYAYDPLLASQRLAKERVTLSTGATVDFDIEDMNNDGRKDILTADTTAAFAGGVNGVNVNEYSTVAGTKKTLDAAAAGYNPQMLAGDDTLGSVSNTYAVEGAYIEFSENGTGGDSPIGAVVATMKFLTLTNSPDQELRVYARLGTAGSGTPESFYVWYSIDGIYFTPIMTVYSESWAYYNYSLPASVASKAIYLRFTDAYNTADSGAVRDWIQVDMAAIFTDTFGGYAGKPVVAGTTWKVVRAAAIDGPFSGTNQYHEVVVAKHHDTVSTNSLWKVYRNVASTWVPLTGELAGSTSFYVSSASKVTSGWYGNDDGDMLDANDVAPTIFDAVDINGDGYTDIFTVNYTTTGANDPKVSKIGFYMNLWSGTGMYWRYFHVKTWTIDAPSGSAKDPWVCILSVINLTVA